MTNAHVTELIAFTIDCSDATRLARFYADLTGGEVTGDYPEYGVAQTTTLGVTLNFQGVKDYAPPAWPGRSILSSITSTSGSPIWRRRLSTP